MNTDEPLSNEEVRIYAERYEAKRREAIETAVTLKLHERVNESWKPLPLLILPYWKRPERTFKWEVK